MFDSYYLWYYAYATTAGFDPYSPRFNLEREWRQTTLSQSNTNTVRDAVNARLTVDAAACEPGPCWLVLAEFSGAPLDTTNNKLFVYCVAAYSDRAKSEELLQLLEAVRDEEDERVTELTFHGQPLSVYFAGWNRSNVNFTLLEVQKLDSVSDEDLSTGPTS